MRYGRGVAALLGLACPAQAQRFGLTHQMLPADSSFTRAVALGDVDGDLDAFVGNAWSYGAQLNRLYLNGGTGAFTDVTATNVPLPFGFSTFTPAVAFGDVDGDGDLDAFVGNSGDPSSFLDRNRLHLNDGTGVFADVTATDMPALFDFTTAVALGDADGDGDLDALVGNYAQQSRLYINLTRQVAWREVPRIGMPLTLDLRGPSWGAWFLGFSTGSANVAIPPFGTLRLDPSNINQAFASLLDAAGKASITFPVPANPLLVGVSVYWQAVVVSPAKLTNLEATTLTDL